MEAVCGAIKYIQCVAELHFDYFQISAMIQTCPMDPMFFLCELLATLPLRYPMILLLFV